MSDKKHTGSLIHQKMKEGHHHVAWLADQIHCTTRTVHRIYQSRDLDTGRLRKIGRALNYNFLKYLSDLEEDEYSYSNKK